MSPTTRIEGIVQLAGQSDHSGSTVQIIFGTTPAVSIGVIILIAGLLSFMLYKRQKSHVIPLLLLSFFGICTFVQAALQVLTGPDGSYVLTNPGDAPFEEGLYTVLLGHDGYYTRQVLVDLTDSSPETLVLDTVTLNEIPVNHAPTDIVIDNTTIQENPNTGDVIGTLSSTDPDVGDTATYSLINNPGNACQIVGNQLRVLTPSEFDHETNPTITVRVRVTDSGGLTYEENIIITVTNVNENPTDISIDNATIQENPNAGDVIGNLSATDPDVGDTATYSLTNNPGNACQIVGNQLQVMTPSVFDYETNPTITVRVRVTDSGGLWHEEDIVITVIDVDDTPPEFLVGYPNIPELPWSTYVKIQMAIDEDGTGYWAIYPDGSGVPSQDDIRNGVGSIYNGSMALTAGNPNTVQVNGLTEDTPYDIYVFAEDTVGNEGDVQSRIDVTTNASPDAVNDDSIATIPAGGTAVIDVLENDSDPNSDELFIVGVTQPSSGGTVEIISGGKEIRVISDGTQWVTLSFSYEISDQRGGSDTASASVDVEG